MMRVKRYEPGAYGAMNESEDGKYYHKRDVDELIKLVDSWLEEIDSCFGLDGFSDEIEMLKKWGVK